MTVHIGQLTAEHAGEALTVQRAAYVAEAKLNGTLTIPPLEETADQLAADLESNAVLAFGAWLGPRLVGSVRGRPEGTRMEVSRFAVAPDMQGRGVGKALLTAIESAVPASVETIWLVTGAASTANIAMYGRAGYVHVKNAHDALGVPVAIMEKPVSSGSLAT
ncbi:acetyltransferase (GNAT) family protein [Herbihabitans rhizosphaerae]|uniref:Acetyltransferase (GNAT) family protein n=1 Tax=Herbihabitans rhizosphaerae TaxID=1872711 RepID=A0A4Q7KIE2_9PSEU|nr:GNAT family N-acetyltransferase [Herbihabitans rhizosphaerae]RZS34354.1 acetyltransferase (GNAT) family protein [Herbihabitans rhizosphaerae]